MATLESQEGTVLAEDVVFQLDGRVTRHGTRFAMSIPSRYAGLVLDAHPNPILVEERASGTTWWFKTRPTQNLQANGRLPQRVWPFQNDCSAKVVLQDSDAGRVFSDCADGRTMLDPCPNEPPNSGTPRTR